MSAVIDRAAIERELRRSTDGAFDRAAYDLQRSMIDTRIRQIQAQQTATPDQAAVVRVRNKPQPAHMVPPPLPSADADEQELRDKLREAQAAYADVQARAEQAKEALARAEEHLRNSEAQLSAYDELDSQAADIRAQQLRDNAYLQIPHHLASAFRERGEVVDRIQIAAKAHATLQTEARNAEAAATIAHERVLYAARDVVFCSAWRLLDQLHEAEQVVVDLRQLLASCKLIGPQGVPPMYLPQPILDAVNKTDTPIVSDDSEFTGVWNDFALRLRSDPDAQPDTDLLLDDDTTA
jgi:hypothetical protein